MKFRPLLHLTARSHSWDGRQRGGGVADATWTLKWRGTKKCTNKKVKKISEKLDSTHLWGHGATNSKQRDICQFRNMPTPNIWCLLTKTSQKNGKNIDENMFSGKNLAQNADFFLRQKHSPAEVEKMLGNCKWWKIEKLPPCPG